MFMTSKTQGLAIAAAVVALAVSSSGPAASAPSGPDLSAFAGTWKMNAELTKMGREGPNGNNIRRTGTFTWKFTPVPTGLRMDVYTQYPQPEPTRTMSVITDGKQHVCQSKGSCLTTAGLPQDQSYAYYYMNPHMLARLFEVKGEVVEYSTYAVSNDGKIFTAISWSPETPQYQNIQVFDRQ